MNTADLKAIASEARLVIDRALDDAEILKGLSEAARAKGIDWTQLKALVKAHAQDARDGGHRVGKLVERADFACAYAAALGGRQDERETETRSSPLDTALAENKRVSQVTTDARMKSHAKLSQELANAGMISQEAADENKAIAAGMIRKFGTGEPDLDIPEYLDRRGEVRQ
jgi:hypothetical protein